MYIREMCLDGFKSYGNRVDIRGFDRMFNAITGLNGSGKSNILDAICFVLGISNLQHVRAGNLQDLVYKFGQAGITKASVSITFDNTDKATSPIGYENVDEIVVTRQVVVGGKNRYLINGLNINNKRIQDLFRSVQLNVNNPTFLIMQGRITKVLNMKSQEILGMIEEAAGTKMYENKKITALTTIDKKNAKLREIDQILIDTINPTIEKLKQERNAYLEYQNTQRTLVHLRRVHVLHSYVHLQSAANEESKKRDDLKGDLDGAEERIRGCDGRIEQADKNIEEIEQKREEDEPTQKLTALSNALKDKERVETSLESDLKGVKETVKDDEKRLATLKKTLQKEEKTLEDREKSQGSTAENWERLKAQMEADEAALQAAQVKVEQASRGNMAGDETSLRSQLDQAQAELTQAKSSVAQAGITIPSLRSAIKKKEDESKRTKGDYDRSAVSSQKLSAEIEQMQRKMMSMNYDEAAADQLQNQRDNLERDLRRLRDYVNSFDDRYPRFAFTFNDPYRNFDRGQVHGVIAKLFTVREQRFMQAIEICAGGRLFNVVLESEQVGKDLLARGRLSRRVTFVPLNRISYHMIDQRTLDNARRAAGSDRIWRAIDLVEFDPRFDKAMRWLLGSQLISETMDDAKKVAFDPRVMRRCITLEGDVFDPSGTMSGGARERGSDLLMVTNEFRAHEAELRQKEVEMRRIDETVGSPEVARQYRVMKDALELKNYELTAMKQRLANTDHQRLLAEIEELRTTLKEQEDIVAQSQDNQKQIAEKIKTLDYKLKNLDKLRDLAIKEAKKELQECEKRAKASAAKAQSFEQEAQQYVVEMEAAKKEIEDLKAKIAELEAKIVEGQGKLPAIEEALEGAKVETNKVKQDMKELKEKIAATDREIQRLQNEKKEALKKKNELKLKVQKLEIDYKAAEDKCAMQDDQISKLMSEYTWLRDEAQKYQDGTSSFEITPAKTRDIERQLVKLEEKEKQLSRHVNVKAMNMLGHMEEKFNSLVKKKDQVESDKKKIQRFIDDLDKKKNDVLTRAHEQVNRDFGSIFSELLPGARAKLVPPKGQTVLDGLEVKVAFGEAWKESLAELSGGQRSLVALSLILAILLFKPAPLYILDEVDAALDLSHTQNIGSMLRKHFRHSQFIVVSLKEGMFSNANVLFKTRFVDGMSTVTRTQNANAMRPLSPSPERDLDKRGKRQNQQQQQAPKA